MTDEILFTREGRIGLVTLNRPQALNALNRNMCVALHRQLMADAAFIAGGTNIHYLEGWLAARKAAL